MHCRCDQSINVWLYQAINKSMSTVQRSSAHEFSCGTLQRRHNGHDSVSNHQPHDCLLNRLFGRRSKKISKLRVTGFCAGIHRRPVNSPHKWPVTRKIFPFDDVIMIWSEPTMIAIELCIKFSLAGKWIEVWLTVMWWIRVSTMG